MENIYIKSPKIKIASLILVGIGVISFIAGFVFQPERTWANFLLNNYYFLSLALGAAFFYTLQYITNSGWSAAFKRIPEAMMGYLPVAGIIMLFIYFGMHSLYEWSHEDIIASDPLIKHKASYLNVNFFYIRLVIYFILWIILARLLRKLSLKEDVEGGMHYFERQEFYSKVYIFILAITMSLASIDFIKSIEPHWFSTVFSLKSFIAAFYHGSSIVILIVFLLHGKGYFPFMNKYHLHDFARYLFMLSIVWGYLWFSQFMIIWYANIPEETVYYVHRWQNGWKVVFYLNVILNWAIPFLVLMPVPASRNKMVITAVIVVLIIGQWVDLFIQIFPGVTGVVQIGWIELGTFLGFVGLFAFFTLHTLGKAPLIAQNHPYLEESMEHHF